MRRVVPHAQLLVAPELHLSAVGELLDEDDGYGSRVAVEIPGPLTERLGEIAAETGLWLVPGSIYERGEAGVHNTALAISPEGELVAAYRKAFPWQPHERTEPGDRFVVFEIPDVARVGLAICYDGFFPEVFRQLAWLGAEVVIQPTLTTTSDRAAELVTARANAIVNQLYLVNVNAAAPAALGRSIVVDPEGPRAGRGRRDRGAGHRRPRPRRGRAGAEHGHRRRVSDVGADRPRRRVWRRAADVRGRPNPAAASRTAQRSTRQCSGCQPSLTVIPGSQRSSARERCQACSSATSTGAVAEADRELGHHAEVDARLDRPLHGHHRVRVDLLVDGDLLGSDREVDRVAALDAVGQRDRNPQPVAIRTNRRPRPCRRSSSRSR